MSAAMSASRVGRKPVAVPAGVDIDIKSHEINIKGPKGKLTIPINQYIDVVYQEGKIQVQPSQDGGYCRSGSGKKLLNASSGTARSTINNAVIGVTKGFERKLVLVGVGYRANIKGKALNLTVGFSHPVDFVPPEGITIETPSQTEILIKGVDKHLVGHTASKIMEIRPVEPYKGKGIIDPRKKLVRKETKKK